MPRLPPLALRGALAFSAQRSKSALFLQGSDDFIDDSVGLGAHLVVGGVLDWMRHEDALNFGEAERDRLLLSGIYEHVRCDHYRGLAINFEPY
jgi:hypothetical protein